MGAALEKALAHDGRALVEERLAGTEITVGVLGNRELQALPVVEIVPKHALFDYQAKYDPELTRGDLPGTHPRGAPRTRPPELARPRPPVALGAVAFAAPT